MSNNVINTLVSDRYFNHKEILEEIFPENTTTVFKKLARTVPAVVQSISSSIETVNELLTALETESEIKNPQRFSLEQKFGWIRNESLNLQNSPINQIGCSCSACCGFSNELNASKMPLAAKDSLASSQVVDSQSFYGEAFSSGGITPQASTGYYFIDALLLPNAPHWISPGSSTTVVTYSFMSAVPSYYAWNAQERNNFVPFNITQINAARRALQLWSEVSGLRFVEVSDAGAGGTIRFGTANTRAGSAHAYYPINHPIGGDVWLNNNTNTNYYQTNGSFGFQTLIHEIGHALGLKHPGNYNAGGGGSPGPYLPFWEDSNQYTVMSYNRNLFMGVNPQTPMLFDIAAIQYLYGANYNTRTGNNIYTWNSGTSFVQTIWDAGGIDTISAANQTLSATINLNPGTFSSIGSYLNGRSIRATNNLALAYGVTIENAIGSSSNDVIIGNGAANSLRGGNGRDRLEGRMGNDKLYGNAGNDTLIGGNGNDRLAGYSSGSEYDILTGGTGTDIFVLGESFGASYQGYSYATITDFNWMYDYIQVKGLASQYSLQFSDWIGGFSQDTAIYYGNDLLGVVQDTTNVNFARDFIFV